MLAFVGKEENNSFMNENQPEPNPIVRYNEFLESPEAVIDNCNATGESAVVTKHGRLMFIVDPLDVQAPDVETGQAE
jgi:hypothetical protein